VKSNYDVKHIAPQKKQSVDIPGQIDTLPHSGYQSNIECLRERGAV
jgi:hypothetical protein